MNASAFSCRKIAISLTIRVEEAFKSMINILKYSVSGVVVGLLFGWALSSVSGNNFVLVSITALGTAIGIVLGLVNRNAQ